MNAIYKVIWNDAIRQYQVVNELCRSRRKACSVKAVHTDGTSRGIFRALKVGALAGTLSLLTLGTSAWAAPYDVPQFTWSLGGGQITSGTFDPGINALPDVGSDERIVVDLSKVNFTDITRLIYGQDEISSLVPLIGVDSSYVTGWGLDVPPPLVFEDANGDRTTEYTASTGFANFKYSLGAGWTQSNNQWVIGLTSQLTEIELTSQDNWQSIDAGETSDVDLSAKITGAGNVTFGFNATGEVNEGWLTLNSDAETDEFKQVNDYTGVTRVGYTVAGSESDPTHLVFGMTEAFGDTSMLMVSSNSEVRFGGINGDKAYTQTVGGLSGTGTLDLGSAAHLTLNQSVVQGVTSAPTTSEPGKLGILNNILGTGATNPESGAVLNVVLDGAVKDYEVVFTDQNVTVTDDQVDFSGLITLTNSAVTAYKNGRSDTVGDQEYTDVNKILTGATLQLKSNGLFRVDSTGELKNLIISSGAGGIEFSGLGNVDADGQGALMINGGLTFDGADATVSIKDFNYNIGEAAAGMDLIDADDGLLNTLVHVKGDVVGEENYGFVLDEASQQEKPVVSAIKDDSGTTIASGTWVLEDELRYDGSGNFDLAYKLTQVDIKEDQTLTISGSDKESEASKTQDFTAKITGSGNIVFDAAENATGSGTRIEIGDASTTDKNDYTGSTTVTDGTTLVLTEDDAMGQTSDLIAYGNVEIGSGIEQTVKNINSSGTGTISIDDSGKLTVDASGDQTINNIISGAGDLNIDLGGSGNKLVFGNSGQGSSFTGDLSLGNGRFSLDDGQNEAFAGSSSIVLGSGAVFDFGSGTSNIKDLTVNADSKLESSALVIGSDTAPHNISGSFSLNSDTTITLTGVSVETDLSLTDYDGGSVSQDFITAGDVTVGADAEITLSGSGDFVNLGNLVLDYQQTQNGSAATVAETVWTVNGSLTQNGNAFQVGTQLKEIRLIGNTILSGSGTSNELSALVTDSDKDGSHSLQFSSADGTQTSFTIVDYAGDTVVGNTYTGETTIDEGVTVTLATDSGFGSTSKLTAEGDVVLLDTVDQIVKGLAGSGTIELLGTSSLTLNQNGSAAIDNILSGSGTFNVNLGGGTDELSFTNTNATTFLGTLSLTNGLVRLESGSATQNVLSGTQLVLGDDGELIVSGTGSDPRHLGGLTLGGGSKIDFSAVTMGDANSGDAQLQVSGGFTINGSNDVSVGGIHLDGTGNILSADDPLGGLKQALVTAGGGISYGTDGKLVIDLDASSMKSEIKNSASGTVAAYGVWSAGGANGEVFTIEGNTLYAALRLSEIQLADTDVGLKLDATGLTSDTTISAKITDYETTAGKIVFEGGNITIANTNDYHGVTVVESGSTVTVADESGFGQTSELDISAGAVVNLQDFDQTVGRLVVGSLGEEASNALNGTDISTLTLADGGTSEIWGSNNYSGTIVLGSGHDLAINNASGIGASAKVGFSAADSVLTIKGAESGTFETELLGAGTVVVSDSNIAVSGALTLERATGAAGDRQSTVVLGTTDDAIQISDSGSEILNAGSVGANVTVISGIGDLVLVNGNTSETVSGSTVIGSDYLHAERPANGTAQEIEQKVILANGSSEYRSVAETVREYDENFTYNSESGTLSIGYKVSDLGLLYETGNVNSSNYTDDSRWQGLTITANAATDETSVFDALIKNGANGSAAGNIVFKGAVGKGTITLAGDENTYTGKTWLTENAQVVFDTDSGFGNTAALRVDAGSSVDFAGHDQSMGALFALGDDALKSTDGANLAVNGTAIINGANANLNADWTFSGSVTIGDELSLGHGAVELADRTTLTIAGSEAYGTIGNAITGGELTNIYVTSGANVSFVNDDILSGPNFTGNIAVWSGASAGFAIESGATVSNGLTIGSTGKVSFKSTSGGTLAFENAKIYGTLELNNVTFDLDAHGDAFNRGSSLVANAGTRIDVSDAVSSAVSNITLNSGSTVAFDNGTPGAAGEGEVASINLGSSGTLTLAGDVTVDLDINDYADASDVEDAQGDLINRPLTAQDLTGQDGGAVLATLIAGQVSSDTADLNLKTDGNDVEENKLNIAIRNAANGEEVATGTYDYKLVLDKDGSGSGLKLSYGLTEVTIRDGKTLELTGTSADEDDNELTAALKGTGNLRITEGEVTLVDKDSDYTGSTSVAAGAALVAGSAGHTLGQTSELRLEGATGVVSGASATILGEETVYGLNVQLGATLNLVAGSGEGAGAVLTVAGGEDDNVIAGNDALGQGGGKLAVSGDGTKLTVEGANSRFTGITSVESGAVLSAGNTASLGTGNTEIAAGGTLEVVAAVDATSGASRVVSQITNSVTGAGDVVINLSGTAQANQKMFRFADDQTSGFSGNIVLENGGYSLAYANDGDAETDYTANQLAAMNSRISVEENGHLYVSTVDHQINRYIDKHVRALTLDGGNIYFGGLRYDMTSMDESLGGQLQLAGDTDKSATLEIKSESLVNLDAGATNTLTDGSELLIADEGAKIDLIQNAADVVLGSGADTIWASSSDEADFTDLLNDYLKLNTVNSDAEQTLTQDGRDVAIVTRGFGSSGHNEVFGVEQNDSSAWDLYLNYHVSKIELIDSENTQGLLITNDEAGSYSDLTALVTGSGNLTLSGVSGTTIALGDGSADTQNDYTGRTTVTGSVTVKAAEDNAFGNTYRLNVESGAKVDFGEFDQTLGILEARGDDALAGTADSVVTITDDMIVTGKNDGFHSQVRLEFSGTGTVSDVGGLGTGDISIGEDYTLVIADENASDGSLVGNKLTGSGTVVIGRDDTTGTIELGGSNAGFTGNVRVESDWTLEASMGKGETTADRIGSGNLVLSNGATGSFTQTEGNLDWTSAVIGEGDLVLSAGKDSDVTISGGLDYFNGDITIGGGRFELASGNGNVENVDGSNLHATGEDTTVVVADQGTVILGDDLSVESGASIVFEGDVTPGTIGDAQLVVAGDLTITESNVTINVGGELDPGDPDTASLNVQDVTSADRSDELALVIAEADNIVLSGNDLVVLGPDGNPINNPEDRLGVSIVDGEEEIATGYYDFGLTSSESGGRDILGVGYRLMEVNVKDGKTLVLNGAHAADVDYENASSFDADITGNGNFALANGELTLTGKNTYTGSTLVGDGTSETTLTVDRGSSLGDTSIVNVSDNATLVNRSDLTDAGSIQVASGGTVTLEDGSVFTVTDVANESNIAGTLTGSGALHLNDNVDIDVAADKAQNFTGIVSVGSGAVYNLLSNVTDTVTVASRFESDSGDDAVVGMTGDFSLEAKNSAYHGAFVLSDGTVIRTNSIASLGAADATITTAGDYAEAGGTASQADDNATVILDYADRETVGDVTQTMTSGITFVKTGDGVVELSAESLGAGAVKSSEGGIIFGAAGDSTVYGTALTVEGGAWAAGFGGVGSLSVASDGAFYLGGVDGYNSIVSSGWTSSEGSSTVQFTVSGNVTNNGTIYVGNKNSSGDTPADSNYIGNELVIEGDYITDGGTLDLNAIIAGKDNSKSDHVTIKGEIDGTGFIDVNYDSSVSTGGELEYLGLVSVAEGESGDSLKLKDSIKIGDLYYRLMWSSEQNEYYLQSSVTDPGDDPWNTEDVENIHAGTRSALAFMQAQAFDLSLRGHLGETLYVDPVTGEQRKSSFWMVQRGDWTKFSNASGQMNADGNLYTTHLGTDLFKRETDGATFRWGVLAGFADGDFDVSSNVDGKSSKGSFRGYSAGLYMTAESKAESGPFLGLQLRWNRFDNEVGPDDYDVNGLSLTAEASWDQLLSKGLTDGGRHYEWRLEPHVRAYWTNFSDPGNWTSRLGETYSSDFDNGLLVRVGARTKIQTTLGTGPAWQAYAEANWVYNNGDYSTTMSTQYGDVTSTQNGAEFAEFRLGLEAQFTTNVNVWLEGHHQTGSDDYESTGAMFGFKYMW